MPDENEFFQVVNWNSLILVEQTRKDRSGWGHFEMPDENEFCQVVNWNSLILVEQTRKDRSGWGHFGEVGIDDLYSFVAGHISQS